MSKIPLQVLKERYQKLGKIIEARDSSEKYQVRNYVRGVAGNYDKPCELGHAKALVHYLKRRGMTAWVVDSSGTFVPIPGAKRNPE